MILLLGLALTLAAPAPAVDPSQYQALRYRLLGPSRGGRSTAVTGIPGQSPHVLRAEPPADCGEPTTRACLAERLRRLLRVGFDRAPSRWRTPTRTSSTRHGSGLPARQRLAGRRHLQVDRRRPDLDARAACATPARSAASASTRATPTSSTWPPLGHAFGPNPERGVFRSKDGGKTWEKVLFVRREDRAPPTWRWTRPTRACSTPRPGRCERKPWTIDQRQRRERPLQVDRRRRPLDEARRAGLPTGRRGQDRRRGLAGRPGPRLGPRRSRRRRRPLPLRRRGRDLEAHQPTTAAPHQRAWYYTHIFADPDDRRPRLRAERRTTSARTTAARPSRRSDCRTATTTTSGSTPTTRAHDRRPTTAAPTSRSTAARTGRRSYNQPTAEIYRVTVDDQFPYRVYGAAAGQHDVLDPQPHPAGG